ncbi:T9SS type A sorting domain-containing protein [Flavobacterium piscinae]|uniref:T9SS type A sorting domain-containing protein n=1 Tax=Flavobacterium piscinae TaxID=2506424 RepID=A0A4Q1KPH3_9FLAO|nr:T9SS type A sorting domain-containing protein [Flavobacterium piscinae]RXR31867.1 T9SS type A sorting domain-containing protein [Flavobacterium piscinae]
MKKITLLFLLTSFVSFAQWNQIGLDIDGENAGDESGTFISINGDGTIIAIGEPRNDALANNAGQVRVFERNGTTWSQLGTDINASGNGDNFGQSIDINNNGDILIVGAPGILAGPTAPGYARVFQWNGSNWIQRGTDIIGEAPDDSCGGSVAINNDGSIIAVGASSNSGNQEFAGHVRLFQWNGTNYTQLGNDIEGEAAQDFSGNSIDLSASGHTIAIGAAGNDGGGTTSGHIRVYEWNGTSWVQKGMDIDGDGLNGNFGSSVSIDAFGNTVTSGAFSFSNGAIGSTLVFSWNGSSWTQKGSALTGDVGSDFFGTSTSLSNDGNIIAVGALGYARIFKFNGSDWLQEGADLLEENSLDQFGRSISLNNNGNIVAIGTPYNDGNGSNAGHVRIFENITLSTSDFDTNTISFYPNPTKDFVYFNLNETIESLSLYNLLGQAVLSKQINAENFSLDISSFSAGSYIAKLNTKGKSKSVKIIKL